MHLKLRVPQRKFLLPHIFHTLRLFVQAPNLTLWVSSGQPLHLVSALSDDGSASGDLFWDDGESIDTYENNQYAYIVFNVSQVLIFN